MVDPFPLDVAAALGRDGAIDDLPDLGDTRAELRIALQQLLDPYTGRQEAARALLRLALDVRREPAVLARVRELGEEHWRGRVVAVLHRAAARGDLPPDADVERIVDVWIGAITYRRVFQPDSFDADLADALIDLVLSGMAPLRTPAYADPPPPDSALDWLRSIRLGRLLRVPDGVPVDALARVPEHRTVVLGHHPVAVTTNLNRDFMPGFGEGEGEGDGSRLAALVSVAADGGGILPPFLRADRIVLLHGDEAWVAPLEEEYAAQRDSRHFQVIAQGGPLWEPGALVDVAVRLVDPAGHEWLVRVPDQAITQSM